MTNSFSKEDRELFVWNNECWLCGKNHADCLHHILGRTSNSPLNAAPLSNFKCHIGKEDVIDSVESKKKFLQKTYYYLKKEGYELNQKDKNFIKKNKKLYPEEIIKKELT